MLMDIFGIAIAFALIMTVLSVIVTSFSQATQAILRLRGRNLKVGLATALAPGSLKPDAQTLNDAADIMNRCDDAGLRRQTKTDSLWSRLVGPATTWLDESALRGALENKANEMAESSGEQLSEETVKETIDGIVDRFGRLDKSLTSRFNNRMRGVSLLWAVLVAAVFQVSTPQLVQELSIDPELRAKVLENLPAVIDPEKAEGEQGADDVTGSNGDTKQAAPNYEEAVAAAKEQMDLLSIINITPMRYGKAYYTTDPKVAANIIGVLLTAILLTLGAPFWYNLLQTAVQWRDVFAPQKDATGTSGTNQNPELRGKGDDANKKDDE